MNSSANFLLGWATIYGATAVVGNVAVVTMGGSAWCRFASDNRRSMIAQFVACPVFIYLAFATGIIVTSASTKVLGTAYWQPFELMRCKSCLMLEITVCSFVVMLGTYCDSFIANIFIRYTSTLQQQPWFPRRDFLRFGIMRSRTSMRQYDPEQCRCSYGHGSFKSTLAYDSSLLLYHCRLGCVHEPMANHNDCKAF